MDIQTESAEPNGSVGFSAARRAAAEPRGVPPTLSGPRGKRYKGNPSAGTGRGGNQAPGQVGPDRCRLEARLPLYLTVEEVARLGFVTPRAVRQAVYRTRAGLARPGDRQFLPRAQAVQAGFARAAVVAWLVARGQTGLAGDRPPRPGERSAAG
jgi:hypothetical protein